jgi:uncharacterized protein YqeY
MKLQERIISDLRESMKNREEDKKSLLRVIISEMNRVGKVLTDDEVVRILKTLKENAIVMNNDNEVKIIQEYLPKMLDDNELLVEIKLIIENNGFTSIKEIGKIMGELKTKFGSTYDGKKANELIKMMLV